MENVREQEVECPECGKKHTVKMYERINVTENPHLKRSILKNELFMFRCPDCGIAMPMTYPCLIQDTERGYMVWYVPAFERTQMEKIFAFNDSGMQSDEYKDFNHYYRTRVVSNTNSLIEKMLIFDEDMDDRVVEVLKVMLAMQLQNKYKADTVRIILFERLADGNYALTALLKNHEPVTVAMDMDEYYKLYTRHKDFLIENTPAGFSIIQSKWATDRYIEIMKKASKGKGKGKK